MKVHRKVKHNEKVSRTQELGPYAQGQGGNQGQRSNCASNHVLVITSATEENLMKLYRKIKHNQKVCCAQVRSLCPWSRPQSGFKGLVIFLR